MRYLYGDSVPFPPQYDFLAALEVFCVQAARVVRVDGESVRLWKAANDAAGLRARAVDELETFHKEAVGALHDGAREEGALVEGYIRQLVELAQRVVDDARRTATATSDREREAARVETDRRRVESRDALERILVAVRLPALETRVRMTRTPGEKLAFSGVFTFEGELVASMTLAGEAVDAWRAPRRVGDVTQGLSLPVGVRRSLFKRTVAPETISLDDYILGGFDLETDAAELRLRKKAELPDSLVFTLRRTEDRVVAEVHYPEDADAESGLPADLDVTGAQEMEKLWQLLRAASLPLLAQKKQLVSLTLGGVDVLEGGLGTRVVSRVVDAIAPTVAEIAQRSPNAGELSLKVENDTGRREEIYLRKAELVTALQTVPVPDVRVFEPLGILPRALPATHESVDALLAGILTAPGAPR